MTLKCALAGIWHGGGKGIIARNSGTGLAPECNSTVARKAVFEDFGDFLSRLKGCIYAAQDVGISNEDVLSLHSRTRFMNCLPPSMGGSGVPAIPTARGVVIALEAAFQHLDMTLKGSSIAVQGVGNVGSHLIELLFDRGVERIIACGLDPLKEAGIRAKFAKHGDKFLFRNVPRSDNSILFESVDAVVPCATGGILNTLTIPQIRAKIICGAANNQLLDATSDDKLLRERRIVYVPDFLCNRMGIVNCADELIGSMKNDPKIEMHLGRDWDNSIYNITTKVLQDSDVSGKTTQEISLALAENLSQVPHPLHGHRGIQIIESLVDHDNSWRTVVTSSFSSLQ
ncbi:UNVERIFIED_CONTAM: hypothetical protein HDU68_001054 [Siphonaria sp. JEL0065]|nr:hypothetical protein HDU68_001054 [Siphonaria sp. JEL0065]